MNYIYVPNINYACYVVQDMNTIRAYHTTPYKPGNYNQSVNIDYTDYYINSHYLEKTGTQSFSYNSTIPTCLNKSHITDDYYYRNDIDSILFIFLVILFVGFCIPLTIFLRMFKRLR